MTEERVVLLSGASRGIGAAIARRLSNEGWTLSLGMRRPELPDGVDTARTHLTDYDALNGDEAGWVNAARKEFGRIDAVIPCAGVVHQGSVIEIGDTDLDAMWEINVKSPRRLVAAAWPALVESGRGRVVIIASLSGQRVKSSRSAPYAMTKHAAIALVHGIRQEGWAAGVRATAICPSFVATDMARGITGMPDADMTQPEDVAVLVQLALDTPNTASLAELNVACMLEERY